MSKRRSIILSVTVQGLSQAEAARLYEVSEATVSRLDGSLPNPRRRKRSSPGRGVLTAHPTGFLMS